MTDLNRRSFMKLGGLVAAAGVMGSCGQAAQKIIPYLVAPDEGINPVDGWYFMTSCDACPSGCGLMVRTVEGRAKKIEGNPDHPVNRGATCVRGQAALQHLYHPDRLAQPMLRTGGKGVNAFKPISFDEAYALLAEKLKPAEEGAKGTETFALCSRPDDITASIALKLVEKTGPANVAVTGAAIAGGLSISTDPARTIDISSKSYIFLLGADIFESGSESPVHFGDQYGRMRRGDMTRRGFVVYAGPRMSLTAANADKFVGLNPGELGMLALAVANECLLIGRHEGHLAHISPATLDKWASDLGKYSADSAEKRLGIHKKIITEIAEGIVHHSGSAVAIAGAEATAHTNGTATVRAVEALNRISAEIGIGRGRQQPSTKRTSSEIERKLASTIGLPMDMTGPEALKSVFAKSMNGKIRFGLIAGGDPVYSSPASMLAGEAISRAEFSVYLGNFLNDTTAYTDLVIPVDHFLETWSADIPRIPAGGYALNLRQPAVTRRFETKPAADVIISAAATAGYDLGIESVEAEVKKAIASIRTDITDKVPASLAENRAWEKLLQHGGYWPERKSESHGQAEPEPSAGESLTADIAYENPKFDTDAGKFPMYFLPYHTVHLGDGEPANIPWLIEMPDPMTTLSYNSWVEINPKTAKDKGISDGDVIRIQSALGAIEAIAYIFPGIGPDTIAMPIGYGHKSYGRYMTKIGASPLEILAPPDVNGTSNPAWKAVRVSITKTGKAEELIRDGHPEGEKKGEVFQL